MTNKRESVETGRMGGRDSFMMSNPVHALPVCGVPHQVVEKDTLDRLERVAYIGASVTSPKVECPT